ncbi:MAG: endonuclease III [Candidatus Micrarchaeota archaeon]|nr:endonuclease III [Candidatus Micrarchaeota archaeon]
MPFKKLDQEQATKAIEALEKEYKDAHYYLNFRTPVDLVAAAILSAQTHDEVVNAVTPELFKKYKTAKDYAGADTEELMGYVKRVTFAGNKARNIINTFKIIEEKYGGKVPNKMEQLVELPGIGRKTANTILINAYGIVEGIPVDTWVIKLSGRIGLSASKDPDDIEQDLMKTVDRKYWKNITYVFKTHGKKVCQSQIPVCSMCLINRTCPRNNVAKSK